MVLNCAYLHVILHASSLAEPCVEEVARWHCEVICECCQHLLLHAQDVLTACQKKTLSVRKPFAKALQQLAMGKIGVQGIEH